MTHDRDAVRHELAAWFAAGHRPLPWRGADVTPWGVLVSEIMLQQTPASRVEPRWRDWLTRWPTPAALAAAPVDEVLRAWDRLGYPRRALRLRDAAAAIVARHDGQVPDDEAALLALPGIGRYTAAAVLAFAFGRRSLVLDVNIRRVLARIETGVEHPAAHETAAERAAAWEWVPDDDAEAALWSASAMEMGAVICTSRAPRCEACPVARHCAWLAAGRPEWDGAPRVAQAWEGTDRQCRGRIMAVLRAAHGPVPLTDVAWPDPDQLIRCADSLVADRLAARAAAGLTLP